YADVSSRRVKPRVETLAPRSFGQADGVLEALTKGRTMSREPVGVTPNLHPICLASLHVKEHKLIARDDSNNYECAVAIWTGGYGDSPEFTCGTVAGVCVRGRWVCHACEEASNPCRRHYTETGGRNYGPSWRAVLHSRLRLAINTQAGEIHPLLGHGCQGE